MIDILQCLLVALWMAFLARQAGGGAVATWAVYQAGTRFGAFWGSAASRVPEALFAFTIGAASYHMLDLLVARLIPSPAWWVEYALYAWFVASSVWSYIWMEAGHGTVLGMGLRPHDAQGARRQTLTPWVEWVSDRFGWEYGGAAYCWFFFATKWFLIGLPIFPFGLPFVVGGPAAYYLGMRVLPPYDTAKAEMLSGAMTGVAVWAAFRYGEALIDFIT